MTGLPRFGLYSILAAAPFLAVQYWAYQEWCPSNNGAGRRPWCDTGVGLSYGWIQREYWFVPSLSPYLPAFALPLESNSLPFAGTSAPSATGQFSNSPISSSLSPSSSTPSTPPTPSTSPTHPTCSIRRSLSSFPNLNRLHRRGTKNDKGGDDSLSSIRV